MINELISVIIPVYDVEDYIDTCMESLVNQTYRDIEMILINDGSTDGSPEKCLWWAKKDRRIRVIDKKNEGVAAARNQGVSEAKGEYIAFVDPDDWVDLTYFEKLHAAIVENDADYAECDLYRYDNRTGKKIYRACYGRMGVPYTLKEHMKYGATATYKALSRKSLWDQYGIRMPGCSFESPAVYSLLLALSNKVVNVREPLYYYRRFRENSLIENGYSVGGRPNNTLAVEAMRFLIGEFKRCGIYEEYKDCLEGVVKYRLSDILAMQYHRKSAQDFQELVENYYEYLRKEFPEGINSRYITFGGYNLNKILEHMNLLHDPDDRFNFSSLISMLGEPAAFLSAEGKNRYRNMMALREFRQDIKAYLANKKYSYLFLDLIEERFDVLEYKGSYITLSDAFEGLPVSNSVKGRVIKRDSDECSRLFKKAVRVLMKSAEESGIRVIVIENYLAEKFGTINEQRPFENGEEIVRMNHILRGYYDFIRKEFPDVSIVRVSDMDLYFTDEKYEYGAIPSHLNELVNQEIAKKIERLM